jgi:hypothetical protein
MMSVKKMIGVAIFLLATNCAWAVDLKMCQIDKAKYQYRIDLAHLILDKTAPPYPTSKLIPFSSREPTLDRCMKLLEEGLVDFLHLGATDERLAKFEVIKQDIHNGMLGYRVFLINKEDQAQFSKVKTLADLRKFKGGYGEQWGDFKTFALNQLPVVGAANTHTLFAMLDKKRFDYFHRGLHEAWAEVEANQKEFPNLKVEETIALVYDFPVYFMFSKKNPALKKRFDEGFRIILKDGSFKQLYQQNFGNYAEKAKIKTRTLIRIDYPTPKGLPPIDTHLWLD